MRRTELLQEVRNLPPFAAARCAPRGEGWLGLATPMDIHRTPMDIHRA